MQQKKQKMTLLTLLWALSACTTPPNFFACSDDIDSGHCVEYMTKKKFKIDNSKLLYKGKTWNQVRAGSAILPSDQLAVVKTFFDNLCHENSCPNNIGDWNGFVTELMPKKVGK